MSVQRWLVLIALLAGLGVLVWMWSRPEQLEVVVTPARRGVLSAEFRAEGEVKGWESALSVPMPAQVVEVLVREGQTVSEGQVLVRFRDREALAAIEGARAQLANAQSMVREARIALQQAQQQANTALQYAQALYQEAKANYELIAQGTPPEELRRAEQELESARAQRDLAQQNYERARQLYEQGAIPRAEYDRAESAYRSTSAQVQALEASLQALKREPRPEVLQSARARLKLAQAEQERARLLQHTAEQMRERLQQALANERTAKAKLEQALSAYQNQQLTAPRTARVKRVLVERGESVNPGMPVLELVDDRTLWIEAEVDQEDAGKVREGTPVTITAPALPGLHWRGTISAILPAFEPKPTLGVRVRILRVRAEMERPPAQLRVGMEVEIAGQGSLHEDALLVPSSAIIEEPNATWVYVVREGTVHRQLVRTGYFTYAYTEVLDGLQEGELVVVQGKQELQEGQRVRVRREQ